MNHPNSMAPKRSGSTLLDVTDNTWGSDALNSSASLGYGSTDNESFDSEAGGQSMLTSSDPSTTTNGSTVLGAALNFTNSIVGAGCIGYGGAVANSGGLVSIVLIVLFAMMSKASYDLIIELGLEYHVASYEALGSRACGMPGRIAVVLSKTIFAFGGMVAFMVVVRDNFSPACQGLLGVHHKNELLSNLLGDETWTTVFLCTVVMLPLSLLRDVSFLERFSGAKIFIFLGICAAVVYFYFALPPVPEEEAGSFQERWLDIKPGVIECMGTFIYGFVAQHTVNIVFRSLKTSNRNSRGWAGVSSISVTLAFIIFLSLGIFSYMTYWDATSSDLLHQYPDVPLVHLSQLCLSLAILFTYPMNLFSVRELVVAGLFSPSKEDNIEQPKEFENLLNRKTLQDDENPIELSWTTHALLTLVLWFLSLVLAISPLSLGDVLNLIGCISGSLIAFILPALFSYRLNGWDHKLFVCVTLFLTGCFVGVFGTYQGLVGMIHKSQNSLS